jgi:asparagine N-glycosylation enzyme membrane subunit Stt3
MDGNTFETPPSSSPPIGETPLRGDTTPLDDPSFSAILDALLRSPARLLGAVRETRGTTARLLIIGVIGLAATGLAMASWSGGMQLAMVPLKLAVLAVLAALVCMPSLHVLSALSGGGQSIKETLGALSMGVALTAVLGLALAPIAWVLSAATSSMALAGTLYLAIFLIAAGFGLGLVRRALATSAGTHVRGLGAWSFMFVIVALQLATTMRPLVGPFDGVWLHERTFFLAHFVDCLGAS